MERDVDPRSRDYDVDARDRAERDQTGTRSPDVRDRSDPHQVFTRGLEVPRGLARERLVEGGREYDLRGSQVRALAAIGAFRVVPAGELRDAHDVPMRLDRGDLYELRRAGLVRVVTPKLHPQRTPLVTLTRCGRALLEAHRRPDDREAQTFYAGVARPKELAHDAQVYRAYVQTADRLHDDGATVVRVRLDHELKRDYQRFLQEGNRGRADSDGRPRRDAEEIRAWAETHHLPFFDERVHFPDVRVEYESRDGRPGFEDLEIRTPHYRGAHAAAKAKAGFTPFDPDVAQEFV
jgi:hypothetical protein